jgi:hypothetical protein
MFAVVVVLPKELNPMKGVSLKNIFVDDKLSSETSINCIYDSTTQTTHQKVSTAATDLFPQYITSLYDNKAIIDHPINDIVCSWVDADKTIILISKIVNAVSVGWLYNGVEKTVNNIGLIFATPVENIDVPEMTFGEIIGTQTDELDDSYAEDLDRTVLNTDSDSSMTSPMASINVSNSNINASDNINDSTDNEIIGNLRFQIHSCQDTITEQAKRIIMQTDTINKQSNQISELYIDIANLTDDLESKNDFIDLQNKQIDNLVSQINLINKNNQIDNHDIVDNQNDTLMSQNDTLNIQNMELIRQNDELQTLQYQLKDQNDELEDQVDALEDKIKYLESMNARLESELKFYQINQNNQKRNHINSQSKHPRRNSGEKTDLGLSKLIEEIKRYDRQQLHNTETKKYTPAETNFINNEVLKKFMKKVD